MQFQSLLFWISLLGPGDTGGPFTNPAVEIMVVMDLPSRHLRRPPATGPEHGVSILVVLDLPSRQESGQVSTTLIAKFQSLLFWISLLGFCDFGQYLALLFQSLLFWISLLGTT